MRTWKYKLTIKDLLDYDNNLSDERIAQMGNDMAERLRVFLSDMSYDIALEDMFYALEEAMDILYEASSAEDIDDALEIVYDIGDEYSIWIG